MRDVSESEEEDTQHLQMEHRNIEEQEKMLHYNEERKKIAFPKDKRVTCAPGFGEA